MIELMMTEGMYQANEMNTKSNNHNAFNQKNKHHMSKLLVVS